MITKYPNRVWMKTDNGWYSREPTKADRERRHDDALDLEARVLERRINEPR
jgi:hypothetical protein